MRTEDFPKLIEVADKRNGNYLTEEFRSKVVFDLTYRDLKIKSGYTVTIKNQNDYNELVKESNLFELFPANDFFDAWPYYKTMVPIYIEGNYMDVLFEGNHEFEEKYGIQTVFGVVERFFSSTFCDVGNVNYPYRLFVYEDYTLGEWRNDY